VRQSPALYRAYGGLTAAAALMSAAPGRQEADSGRAGAPERPDRGRALPWLFAAGSQKSALSACLAALKGVRQARETRAP